jgi:short-subunit dehydrogenase
MTAGIASSTIPLRVFITGATSGIGEALARYYAEQGAVLGLLARRAEALKALNAELGGQHWCYPYDVSHAYAIEGAAKHFMLNVGVPDVVIASAGISAGTLTEELDDYIVFERILNVNVLGTVAVFSPFIKAMKKRRNGKLVGIASVAGIRGLPGAGAYSASKAAVINYLESLRVELRGSGVKVITLAPGYIDTPMTRINPYPMPFLMPADKAARRFAKMIDKGVSYGVAPWPMAIVAKLMRLLPNCWYDRIFAKAPHKPRGIPAP